MPHLSRLHRHTLPTLVTALIFSLAAPAVLAQDAAPGPTWSQEDTLRIAKEIQKKLAGLTNYSVFDWITFGFHGKTVVVKGYASRPILKSDVTNALKGISGVESVDNQIEVLPLLPTTTVSAPPSTTASSPSPLSVNTTPTRAPSDKLSDPARSIARAAGGITNDPPRLPRHPHHRQKRQRHPLWRRQQ